MKSILAFFCFLLMVGTGFAKDKRPNVITLLVDDLGYRDLGCYGGALAPLPSFVRRLDRVRRWAAPKSSSTTSAVYNENHPKTDQDAKS